MLAEKSPGRFTVACDKCRAVQLEVAGGGRQSVGDELRADGWHEAAQKGQGRDRWQWWCPACAPKVPKTSGLTTTGFMVPRSEPKKVR